MASLVDQQYATFLTDSYLAWVKGVIAERGFLVQVHAPTSFEPDRPVFCYTVGLTKKGLPEVCMALKKGDPYKASDIVRSVAHLLLDEQTPPVPGPVDVEVLGHEHVRLVQVDNVHDATFPLVVATRVYGGKTRRVQALQVVLEGLKGSSAQPRVGQNPLARLARI